MKPFAVKKAKNIYDFPCQGSYLPFSLAERHCSAALQKLKGRVQPGFMHMKDLQITETNFTQNFDKGTFKF
jgi:hypothetical protein